jgi:hypothetical protein
MLLFDQMRCHMARRALQEIERVQQIILKNHPNWPEDVIWDALENTPQPPLPGIIHVWFASPLRPRQQAYGMTFTVGSRFLGVDAHASYYSIVFPSGRVALGLPPDVVSELSSILNRFAASLLFAEHGWSFPADLARPEAFVALSDLLTCGGRRWQWNPVPPGEVPNGASGELLLIDPKSPTPRGRLSWTSRRLWLELAD